MLDRRKFLSFIPIIGLVPLLGGQTHLASHSEAFTLDLREIIERKGPIVGVGFVARNCTASERLMTYCRSGKNFFNENRTCWIEMDSSTPIRDLDGKVRTPREVAKHWSITILPAFVVVLRGHHPAAARIGIGRSIKRCAAKFPNYSFVPHIMNTIELFHSTLAPQLESH